MNENSSGHSAVDEYSYDTSRHHLKGIKVPLQISMNADSIKLQLDLRKY